MVAAFQIDTLAYAKKLKDAGADERIAEAIVEGLMNADTSTLAKIGRASCRERV